MKSLTDKKILSRLKKRGWTGKHVYDTAKMDDYKGVTALMCALRLNNLSIEPEIDLIEAILSRDIDINALDHLKNNALWYVYNFDHLPVLVEKGLDVNHKSSPSKNTMLDEILEDLPHISSVTDIQDKEIQRCQKAIETLIEFGAEVNEELRSNLDCEYWENCITDALSKREKKVLNETLPQASKPFEFKNRI